MPRSLVVNEPQLGFRVTPLSLKDLRQLTEVPRFHRGQVIRLAVVAGDVEWESTVVAAHHLLERTPETVDTDRHRLSEDWVAAHARFPRRSSQPAGTADSSRWLRTYAPPRSCIGGCRCRRAAARPGDIPGEHHRNLRAVLDHDADGAVALSEHTVRTSRRLDPDGGPARESEASA